MGFPAIEVSEVGPTGLAWLLITYAFVLYEASNLISGGSDLLLLVPSMAGLVGGVVLPLLGAVPDGAIMLFSGLGDIETARETLAVGVGTLAGSTIMLLTVSWALCVFAGRVDTVNGAPDYKGKPKLSKKKSFCESLTTTAVDVSPSVRSGAVIMMSTTISYLIIQVPALFIGQMSEDQTEIGAIEEKWAILAFSVCLVGFFVYLHLQFKGSNAGDGTDKSILVMQKNIAKDKVSLRMCIYDYFKHIKRTEELISSQSDYRSIEDQVDPKASQILKLLLKVPFDRHDIDGDHVLDKGEIRNIFLELNERNTKYFVNSMFEKYDVNNDGKFSFDEFVSAAYGMYKEDFDLLDSDADSVNGDNETDEEEEEIPEDLLDLTPAQQQKVIKMRAFAMLTLGTLLVLVFSDPMVEVIGEMAKRLEVGSFYVSFILVPFASNASELLASRYYAMKKTKKTIAVSLSALEGAASMNNTFCLAIFMGLIIFRNGLAWQYTAETAAIIFVQIIVGIYARKKMITYLDGWIILALYPLSIALVYVLEGVFGLD